MTLDEAILGEARAVRERMLDLQRDTEQARVDFHHAVRRLHAAGGSLREIADALGLSHQRVHQIVDGEADRFGKRVLVPRGRRGRVELVEFAGQELEPSSGEQFRRFSGEARQAVVEAQDEARELGHDYVGTEHLLLGLLRRADAPAGRALGALGVTLDDVRARVEAIVGRGSGTPPGAMRFAPRSKKALEVALREALKAGQPEIGTEHLLLALVRERAGVAAEILGERGIGRKQVEAVLGSDP